MGRPVTSKVVKEDVTNSTVVKNATVENNSCVKTTESKKVVKENLTTEKKEVENRKPFTINQNGKVSILCKERANKSIIATTGNVIKFNNEGIAEIEVIDALYLQNINGFIFK